MQYMHNCMMYSCVNTLSLAVTVKMSMIIDANKGWQALTEYVLGLLKRSCALKLYSGVFNGDGLRSPYIVTGLPAGTSVTFSNFLY